LILSKNKKTSRVTTIKTIRLIAAGVSLVAFANAIQSFIGKMGGLVWNQIK
jgi:hypothetical protein